MWIKKFNSPLKAIDYFFDHTILEYNKKEKVIETFLSNFPSERANLEKLIAQSQPKCTEDEEKKYLKNRYGLDKGQASPL